MKSDIRQELLELQVLQGIDFVRQLKLIVSRKEFRPLDTDSEIFLELQTQRGQAPLKLTGTVPVSTLSGKNFEIRKNVTKFAA